MLSFHHTVQIQHLLVMYLIMYLLLALFQATLTANILLDRRNPTPPRTITATPTTLNDLHIPTCLLEYNSCQQAITLMGTNLPWHRKNQATVSTIRV